MWRRLTRALGSVACFAAVLGVLFWLDPRVGQRLAPAAADPSHDWVGVLRASTQTAIQAARDQSLEHAPLVIFALAAAVLVLLMVRT
jgi:hypothetical protein